MSEIIPLGYRTDVTQGIHLFNVERIGKLHDRDYKIFYSEMQCLS